MTRSFHYAVYGFLLKHGSVRPEDAIRFDPWAGFWYRAVAGIYLSAYRETVGNAPFLPPDARGREMLLNIFLLEKAVYELGYELGNRPDWIGIPIRGVRHILQGGDSTLSNRSQREDRQTSM
jgi:maltose alpha-D-glucosyltransferase/alpha-amylase